MIKKFFKKDKKILIFLSILSLFLLHNILKAEEINKRYYEVTGITNVYLLNNLALGLNSLDENDRKLDDEDYRLLLNSVIDKALKPYGYYHVTKNIKKINQEKVLINIDLGSPIRVEDIDIIIQGQGAKDAELIELTKEKTPNKNDILRHYKYDGYKQELDDYSLINGYFEAEYLRNRLEIDPYANLGYWRLTYDTKQRYKFGDITLKDSQIEHERLKALIPFNKGDYYSLEDISKAKSNLYLTDWFNIIDVKQNINKDNKTVDMDLKFAANKKNRVTLSIGYDTVDKMRGGIKWIKPWINKKGHSISSELFLSKPHQRFNFLYRMPLKKNPNRYYYEIFTDMEKEKNIDVPYSSITTSILRYWKPEKGWQFGFGFGAIKSKYTEDGVVNRSFLFYPSFIFQRTRLDNDLFPFKGDSQQLLINLGRKNALSDTNFIQAKLNLSFIRSINRKHRFILRSSINYLKAKDFSKIPPPFRFYVGGDRSIRGFPYKSISDKNSKGTLIGSTKSITGSAEYQYNVYKEYWGAIFYDIGMAGSEYSTKKLNSGAGIGFRWQSPIGAIRLDVAKPIKNRSDRKDKIQIYLGIGAEI